MSGERFFSRSGERTAAQHDEKFGGCLTDSAIQSIADGTLRGPELFLARQHIDECPRCTADLDFYSGLARDLDKLQAPPLPPGFTQMVIGAVELRERTRDERHRAILSALPAALIALGILFLWAMSGSGARVRDLVIGATVAQRVAEASFSVLSAARLPLGIGALLSSVAVFALLVRSVASLRASVRS